MARIIETGPNDPDIVDETRRDIYYSSYSPAARFIWTILTIVNGLLALRFLLKLFAANPAAGFTTGIYNLTAPLVNPFINVIRSSRVSGLGIVEWFTILAMIVYWLIAYALVRLFTISRPVARY